MIQVLSLFLLLSSSLLLSATASTTLKSEVARIINEGINYHNNRNYLPAIQSFNKALELDPENRQVAENLSIAHNNYGKYLAERTDGKGAAREFRNALYYDPANNVARANLEYKLKENKIDITDPLKRIELAKQERNEGNFTAAIAELKEVNRVKDNEEAHLEIGSNYHLLSIKFPDNNVYVDNAIESFKKAQELNPSDIRPLIKLGDVYISLGKINYGIDYYEQAVKLAPDNQEAQDALINGWLAAIRIAPHLANNHVGLGTAYQLKRDFVQAERSFRRALQIDPNNTLAKNGLSNLRDDQVKTQISLFLDQAVAAQKQKDYNLSLASYIKALNLDPNNPDIHYDIGTAFQAKDDIDRARKAYAKALELNPKHFEAKAALDILDGVVQEKQIVQAFNEAVKLQETGKYAEAIKIYKQIQPDRPNDESLFYNLAAAYQAQGNEDEAIANYRKAYAINPDPSYTAAIKGLQVGKANELLALAIEQQGKADNDNAIANYLKVIELVPDNANAWYNLGTAYQAVGKDIDALNAYKKAYTLDAKNQSEAMFFAALILEEQRKLLEAMDLYAKYLATDPKGQYVSEAKERQDYIKSFL